MTARRSQALWALVFVIIACVGVAGRAVTYRRPFGVLEWIACGVLILGAVTFQILDTMAENKPTDPETDEIPPVTIVTRSPTAPARAPAGKSFDRAQHFNAAIEGLRAAREVLSEELVRSVTNCGLSQAIADRLLAEFDQARDALLDECWQTRPDPNAPVWTAYYHRHVCSVLGDITNACANGLPAILAVIEQAKGLLGIAKTTTEQIKQHTCILSTEQMNASKKTTISGGIYAKNYG